jgi:hypothetical protein
MEQALRRLSSAIEALGKIKNGKTLFEISTADPDSFNAWMELNAAQKQAIESLE